MRTRLRHTPYAEHLSYGVLIAYLLVSLSGCARGKPSRTVNTLTNKPTQVIAFEGPIRDFDVSPVNTSIAVLHSVVDTPETAILSIFQLPSLKLLYKTKVVGAACHFANNGRALYVKVPGEPLHLRSWDSSTWTQNKEYYFDTGFITRPPIFSSDLTLVAMSDVASESVVVLERQSIKGAKGAIGLKPFVEDLFAFSRDSKLLVGSNSDMFSGGHFTIVWDVRQRKSIQKLVASTSGDFSHDDHFLFLGKENGDVQFWDTKRWYLRKEVTYKYVQDKFKGVSRLVASPFGDWIAIERFSGAIDVLDHSREQVNELTRIDSLGKVLQIRFTPDNEFVVLAAKRSVFFYRLPRQSPKADVLSRGF